MGTINYWDIRYAELLRICIKTMGHTAKVYKLAYEALLYLDIPLPSKSIERAVKKYTSADKNTKRNLWKPIEDGLLNISTIPKKNEKVLALKDRFSLVDYQIKIIEFLYLLMYKLDFYGYFSDLSEKNKTRLCSSFIAINEEKILEEFGNTSSLLKLGIVVQNNYIDLIRHKSFLLLLNPILISYFNDTNNLPLSSFLMQELQPSSFSLDTFDLPKETILSAQCALKRPGPAYILLYGEPGTGKSELSRALVYSSGLKPYSLTTDDKDGSRPLSNLLLSAKIIDLQHEVLIIDEADSLLNVSDCHDSEGRLSSFKAILNQFLDRIQIKIIFITNQINGIHPSFFRRMHILIGFKRITYQHRKRIWDWINQTTGLFAPEELHYFAREYRTNPARIRQIYEICSVLKEEARPQDEIVAVAKDMLSRSEELFSSTTFKYDHIDEINLDALHLSLAPGDLIERLRKWQERFSQSQSKDLQGVNLLFYGISGAGKSALARYIARELNQIPIHTKASDLLSPYVGVTEERIREVFQEAHGGILIIDEADSFILNRQVNERSWERSQTNEFLIQMEQFRGIFIATTNFEKALDGASFRRFTFKVEFLPPTAEQRLTLARRYFPHITWEGSLIDEIRSLEGIVPGDFATVAQRLAFIDNIEASLIIKELQEELKARSHLHRKIGFL